jgi:2-C-methyl-D-erythritol 4-phosphate cytidylyltransferase
VNRESRLALIIPAAGSGQRLGADIPKPYLVIAGKTVLEHTLLKFRPLAELSEVVISTSPDRIAGTEMMAEKIFPDIPVTVVEGGAERQHSIMNALNSLTENSGLVAVHDAVRPFIETETISLCVDLAVQKGAAIVAVPAKDTIKVTDSNQKILNTPDRSRLWQAQTPQIFKTALLIDAYQKAIEEGFIGTDDASLVENLGHEVFVMEGARENFKITYPLDLKLAEWILGKKTS